VRVPDSPCCLISDTHLGIAPLDTERRLIAFLRSLPGRAKSLVINGDLYDFWFEWRSVIPRPAFRVLAALADLHDADVSILYIAGNHDCWGGEVLEKDVGAIYHVGPWEGTLAGWRTRIEHGDGLRQAEDKRYRMIRPVLRSKLSMRAFRLLPPDWASALATGSSSASRNYRARDEGRGLRAIALKQLEKDPSLDLIVYGHSHVSALERAPGGGVFANAGSWLDEPTYLWITPDRIELRRWAASAESDRLHALDRRAEERTAKA
jgi:UDP-2,3-diacylglucosamine hydrolase